MQEIHKYTKTNAYFKWMKKKTFFPIEWLEWTIANCLEHLVMKSQIVYTIHLWDFQVFAELKSVKTIFESHIGSKLQGSKDPIEEKLFAYTLEVLRWN